MARLHGDDGSDGGAARRVSGVKVRPVLPSEYEQAGQLVVGAYRSLPGSRLSDEYAVQLADVASRAGQTEVMVALSNDGDGLIGCVTFVPDSSSPWAQLLEHGEAGVRMLAVEPRAQGHGAGRALVQACVGRARELHRTALVLHTTPWMTAAHHLYETSGFERIPERDWAPIPGGQLLAYRHPLH
jgi:ribosomal protein S18 acetylase RimI-like enzyme